MPHLTANEVLALLDDRRREAARPILSDGALVAHDGALSEAIRTAVCRELVAFDTPGAPEAAGDAQAEPLAIEPDRVDL